MTDSADPRLRHGVGGTVVLAGAGIGAVGVGVLANFMPIGSAFAAVALISIGNSVLLAGRDIIRGKW